MRGCGRGQALIQVHEAQAEGVAGGAMSSTGCGPEGLWGWARVGEFR